MGNKKNKTSSEANGETTDKAPSVADLRAERFFCGKVGRKTLMGRVRAAHRNYLKKKYEKALSTVRADYEAYMSAPDAPFTLSKGQSVPQSFINDVRAQVRKDNLSLKAWARQEPLKTVADDNGKEHTMIDIINLAHAEGNIKPVRDGAGHRRNKKGGGGFAVPKATKGASGQKKPKKQKALPADYEE